MHPLDLTGSLAISLIAPNPIAKALPNQKIDKMLRAPNRKPSLLKRIEKQRFSLRKFAGGRILTLEKDVPDKVLPFVTSRSIALKRPYVHYRVRAA
jgi:hypothetical protein